MDKTLYDYDGETSIGIVFNNCCGNGDCCDSEKIIQRVNNHTDKVSESLHTALRDIDIKKAVDDVISRITSAQNDINDLLFSEDYASLNMFYDFLGLEHTRLGAELGWKIDSGTLQIDFSSTLASDKSQGIAPGTPCLVLDYNVAPKYDFDKMCY